MVNPSQQDLYSKRILLADGDTVILEIMRKFLTMHQFRVNVATTSDEALDLLRKDDNYDLVLADVRLLPMNGFNFCTAAGAAFPHMRFALLSNEKIDGFFPVLRRSQLNNVFIKTKPFLFDEFLFTVENLLQPARALGLQRYLRQPAEVRQYIIKTREEHTRGVEEGMSYFSRYRQHASDISEMRLTVEELINNALYHAFRRKSGGTEKYRATSFTSLEENEQIVFEYGRDKFYLGCSITDNQGSMDAVTVMNKLERQISQEGIMDENGRGLYLTRNLCDRMIINLKPGRLSQIVLLFSHQPTGFSRPLNIHIIPDVL